MWKFHYLVFILQGDCWVMNSGLTIFILFYYFREVALPSFGLHSSCHETIQ